MDRTGKEINSMSKHGCSNVFINSVLQSASYIRLRVQNVS